MATRGQYLKPAEDDPFPLSTKEAAEALGIARQSMNLWIKKDVFKLGYTHIRRTPGKLAPFWWSIEACREAITNYNATRTETYEL